MSGSPTPAMREESIANNKEKATLASSEMRVSLRRDAQCIDVLASVGVPWPDSRGARVLVPSLAR